MKKSEDLKRFIRSLRTGAVETRGVSGILAGLWWSICCGFEFTESSLEKKLTKYARRIEQRMLDAGEQFKPYNKGNIRREITDPRMTFEVLVKLLGVIDILKCDLIFEFTYKGEVYKVKLEIIPSELEGKRQSGFLLGKVWIEILTICIMEDGDNAPILDAFERKLTSYVEECELNSTGYQKNLAKAHLRRELIGKKGGLDKLYMSFKTLINGCQVLGLTKLNLIAEMQTSHLKMVRNWTANLKG